MKSTISRESVPVQPLALNFDPSVMAIHNALIREAFDRRFTRPMANLSNDRHTATAKAAYAYDALRSLSVELGYIVVNSDFSFAELSQQLSSISYPRLRKGITHLKDRLRRRKIADNPVTLKADTIHQYLDESVPF